MTARHGGRPGLHRLHVDRASPVHGLAPEVKLAGLALYVVAVALTPRRAVASFAVDAAALVVVVAVARLPLRTVLARLAVVIPFLVLAACVPFLASGERVDVLGTSVSAEGLWASWNIVAKAVLGATASIVLSATTPVADILHGLARLRVPRVLLAIVAFMVRYVDLLVDQLSRMRRAMVARCHDPRWLWQARPVAASLGTLFVRSYERGERIHRAMVARGFTGTMPDLDDRRARARDWLAASGPGIVAVVALVGGAAR